MPESIVRGGDVGDRVNPSAREKGKPLRSEPRAAQGTNNLMVIFFFLTWWGSFCQLRGRWCFPAWPCRRPWGAWSVSRGEKAEKNDVVTGGPWVEISLAPNF